jgi:hypothetical protein
MRNLNVGIATQELMLISVYLNLAATFGNSLLFWIAHFTAQGSANHNLCAKDTHSLFLYSS